MAGLARVLLSAIALAAAPARADGPICGPHPRAWDKDHARSPSPAAKRRFCEWMRDRAYWPE